MSNRKILYGYQIQRGELATVSKEADTVRRIATLYLNGLSYQKISDTLNGDRIPFSGEAPSGTSTRSSVCWRIPATLVQTGTRRFLNGEHSMPFRA